MYGPTARCAYSRQPPRGLFLTPVRVRRASRSPSSSRMLDLTISRGRYRRPTRKFRGSSFNVWRTAPEKTRRGLSLSQQPSYSPTRATQRKACLSTAPRNTTTLPPLGSRRFGLLPPDVQDALTQRTRHTDEYSSTPHPFVLCSQLTPQGSQSICSSEHVVEVPNTMNSNLRPLLHLREHLDRMFQELDVRLERFPLCTTKDRQRHGRSETRIYVPSLRSPV